VRFSAKEAVYKAVDPFVRRYVAFSEAYVAPNEDGSAVARLTLRPDEPRFVVDVRWLRRDGLVLTTARVSRDCSSGGEAARV
jgi:4'-phosphopantetheinyl transferase EntD